MTTNDPLRGERRLAAIMFTDMVGFTALSQRDEALALRLVEEHRQLIRSHLAMHDGREVKTMGDGALVEFTSPLAVFRCAIEIQSALAALNAERRQNQRADLLHFVDWRPRASAHGNRRRSRRLADRHDGRGPALTNAARSFPPWQGNPIPVVSYRRHV